MDDQDVMNRINELASEEHELFERASRDGLSPEEHERLRWLGIRLDQTWDLLHQRRALRNAGLNPDEAKVRDAETVEGYVE
jgi:hypothetical protein